MILISPVFLNNQEIPSLYTCNGSNVNPPLEISDIPSNTVSLALIMDDPDAPSGLFTHWLVWNISPNTRVIAENSIPEGAMEGVNSANQASYYGPCPPSGIHRYFFHLYSIDVWLKDLKSGSARSQLESAINDHIIEHSQLIGLYSQP